MSPFHKPGDPFGIYVHWPFCAAKCPYCDFNSHVRHKPVDQELFAEAYEREIAWHAERIPGRRVTSIFFGGGTPSLMEPRTLERIMTAISSHFEMAGDAEVTLEANPTSVEAGRFRAYRQAGVNRLSLGIQSLDDTQLKFLGRQHSAAEAREAIELARSIFPRISFDLIYARPGQDDEAWRRELREAMALAAGHLSLYQLTIEQGTPFFDLQARGRLKVPDPDHAAMLYEVTAGEASAAGYAAYEISNYALPGQECRHNLVYWDYRDYAGIGPGAHGRLTLDGKRLATAALRNPEAWWQQAMSDGNGMESLDMLSSLEAADEFLLMGLRLATGIDTRRYAMIAGRELDSARIEALVGDGLLEVGRHGRLRTTPAGALLLDAVVADLAA